jgi:hypothetical protein
VGPWAPGQQLPVHRWRRPLRHSGSHDHVERQQQILRSDLSSCWINPISGVASWSWNSLGSLSDRAGISQPKIGRLGRAVSLEELID